MQAAGLSWSWYAGKAPESAIGLAPEVVGLLVQRGDQPFDAAVAQDRGEIGAPRRQLADRPRHEDVADLIADRVVVHHVVDRHRLAVRFGDPGFDHAAALDLLLAQDIEPLAGIAVEAASIDRGNIAA